eukprot:TRINITY_DN374_c0_g3_i1.p1 TRINITY_DN374_c0_g3~~TRINITY_DN374_c0_g3_i1.p1  ORF type:complete len:464 (+),score=175.01 TRINITY_DN374_c0_g3_i1:41-1432(+)
MELIQIPNVILTLVADYSYGIDLIKRLTQTEEQDLNKLTDLEKQFYHIESLKRISLDIKTKYYNTRVEFWIIDLDEYQNELSDDIINELIRLSQGLILVFNPKRKESWEQIKGEIKYITINKANNNNNNNNNDDGEGDDDYLDYNDSNGLFQIQICVANTNESSDKKFDFNSEQREWSNNNGFELLYSNLDDVIKSNSIRSLVDDNDEDIIEGIQRLYETLHFNMWEYNSKSTKIKKVKEYKYLNKEEDGLEDYNLDYDKDFDDKDFDIYKVENPKNKSKKIIFDKIIVDNDNDNNNSKKKNNNNDEILMINEKEIDSIVKENINETEELVDKILEMELRTEENEKNKSKSKDPSSSKKEKEKEIDFNDDIEENINVSYVPGIIDEPLKFNLDDGFDSTIQQILKLRQTAQSLPDDQRKDVAAHVALAFFDMLGGDENDEGDEDFGYGDDNDISIEDLLSKFN